jgi:hypothetical protein
MIIKNQELQHFTINRLSFKLSSIPQISLLNMLHLLLLCLFCKPILFNLFKLNSFNVWHEAFL